MVSQEQSRSVWFSLSLIVGAGVNRRKFNHGLLWAMPLGGVSGQVWSAQPGMDVALARGGKGWSFASPEAFPDNYVMEEFLLSGEAHRYEGLGDAPFPKTGEWRTKRGVLEPFTTRAYVVRPRSADDFNGVAIVNWQNVTAGFDLGAPLNAEIFRGYAWIGLTTQKIGVDGTANTPGLRQWDPERYGGLRHPGDAWSYDMFSRLGRDLKSPTPASQRLLGGLAVDTLIASGASQSAMRLGTYINAAHAHERVYDGFHLTVHWGICPPVEEVELMTLFAPTGDQVTAYHSQLRDDLDVPILSIATECESRYNYPVRQPDTDTHRFWEVAGASHQSPLRADDLRKIMSRDGVQLNAPPIDRNTVHWDYIDNAGLRALTNWIREGVAPVSVEQIRMSGNRMDSAERDEHGNVKGGIRVPELEAPVASYRGERGSIADPSWLSGQTLPFSAAKIAELYPNGRAPAWNAAVDRLKVQGLVLPEDEASVRARV